MNRDLEELGSLHDLHVCFVSSASDNTTIVGCLFNIRKHLCILLDMFQPIENNHLVLLDTFQMVRSRELWWLNLLWWFASSKFLSSVMLVF